jgi:hypothetical protein
MFIWSFYQKGSSERPLEILCVIGNYHLMSLLQGVMLTPLTSCSSALR